MIKTTIIEKENTIIEIEILNAINNSTNITIYATIINIVIFVSIDFYNFVISRCNIYLYNILNALFIEI